MRLTILKDNEESLRIKSIPTLITDEVRVLVKDMKETMLSENGIGLSALKWGLISELSWQLMSAGKLVGPVQEMINPVITNYSDDTMEYEEGCLSIPGEYTYRSTDPRSIHVKFQTLSGKYKKWFLKGLEACIVQHEIDHLNGVLMTDL